MHLPRQIAKIPASEFLDRLAELTPAEQREALRLRFRYDLPSFCRYCWPDRFNLPFSALHHDLFERSSLPTWQDRRGMGKIRDAVAAPRGYAKSTISTFALVVHAIVYDLEAYIIVMSAGQRLSRAMSKDLRNVFRASAGRLHDLYGPFEVSGGIDEWLVSVAGRPSVGILPSSFGSEIRGAKHPERGIRPTRVIVDDGEKKDRVRNPDQRQIWWDFLTKDVLKLGLREGGTAYQVRGTVLHTDSMLARLLKRPGWSSAKYQAILSWPERMDLWERCGRIWKDLTLGEVRERAARAFYEANREEMDAGAEVLDPEAESLYDLFVEIWGDGLASFLQEKQNDPIDPNARIFDSTKFARFRRDGDHLVVLETGRRVAISDLRKFARWDPATGTAHGDYAAIAVLGRDEYGYTFVLELWMRRAKPSVQHDVAWQLAQRWNCRRMKVESNGFQELVAKPFRRERKRRRKAGEWWQLQIVPEPSTENKEHRISTMEPDVTNGWMLFPEGFDPVAAQQFDEFPSADHDDGPDVIHGAWRELGGSPVGMVGEDE